MTSLRAGVVNKEQERLLSDLEYVYQVLGDLARQNEY